MEGGPKADVGAGDMGSEATRVPTPYADWVTDTPFVPETDQYRLDRRAVPSHYRLTIEPDADAGTFTGAVAIDLDVTTATDTLVCNAADLDLADAWVQAPDGTRYPATIELHPDTERASFTTETALTPGAYRLFVGFAGRLDGKLRGIYRSTYTDTDGAEQHLVVTQFEATDARRAFPCWDEPSFKATFAITLVVPADHLAVSNSAEVGRTPADGGRMAVEFATTMVMSTYLVAFVVGPLEVTDPVDAGGVPVRIVHPPGKGHLAHYGLEVATFCLKYFAEYYAIDYPGDKLDMVAIPDFAFGAMENLGCVTFREVLLLVDPAEATQPELQNVTDVIAHELAHMWFGDLVTMDWWEGIWLNEAFATFMEMAATDAFRPDWDRWTSFGVARTAAFDVDALRGTRPIEFPVVSPDEAEAMFDVLTYEKGAAVLRMFEQWLGPDEFRSGIRQYLADHAYGNTRTSDLWDALEAATGRPVRRVAESWILQGGFPLVTVDLVDEGRTLRFGQERFGYAGDRGEDDMRDVTPQTWPVPIIFSQSGGGVVTVENELIEADGLDVQLVERADWVVANAEGTGFFRTAYAPDLLSALVTHARSELSPIERYTIVDDAWAAVLADRLDVLAMLELLGSFVDEGDVTVWQRIVAVLDAMNRLVVHTDARRAWESLVCELLHTEAARLGTTPAPGESDRTRQLRGVLLGALGVIGADPGARMAAHDLHAAAVADPLSVDPALAAAAVSIMAAAGGHAEFDAFAAQIAASTTPQDELRYLTALADFDHPELIDRLLTMCIDGTVRSQNAPYLLRRAMANRTQGTRAWSFVSTHWDTINDQFPSNSIARMIEGVRYLDHPADAALVFAFFETNEVPQGDRIVAQHLERLEVNLALRDRASERLEHHLRHG
jgi:puromycin-sensitive aminopeptidase